MSAERFFTHPFGIISAACGATFLWGSAFPFIKLSYHDLLIGQSETFKQLLFAGYRFIIASLLIFLFMFLLKKEIKFHKNTLHGLIKVGSFQTFLQYLFFYIGLSHSTGIQGSIIAGSTSFFQILIAHFMYQNDHINLRKITGLSIGFLGIIVVNLSKGSFQLVFGLGEILLLVSAFCGAMGNVLSKNESAHLDVLYLTAYQMFFGGLGLTIAGTMKVGLFPFVFDKSSLAILFYLAFLSAAGFVLWNNVMKYNKVGNVSMYLFLIPVSGVLLSSLILGESMHLTVLVALALVVSGIIIVNRVKQHPVEISSRRVS